MLTDRLRRLAWLHGLLGATCLAGLVVSRRQSALSGPFARDAIVLLAAALCGGLSIAALRGRAAPGLVVFLHASAGGLAYLLLAGFVFGR